MAKFARLGAFWGIALSVFSPPEAFGGINENFVQSVAPTSVRGPAPDAELPVSRTLVIFAANVDSAKQIAAEIVYDPAVFGNFTFVGGNLVTGALILPAGGVAEPEIREDGLASVSASGAKLQGRGLSAGDTPKRVFVVTYDIIGSIPETGSFISVTSLRIGLSSSDVDIKTFALGRFGVRVRSNFANQIIDLKVDRGFERAAIGWETRLPGINDTVRYRQIGEEIWLSAHNPLLEQATDQVVGALILLFQRSIDPTEATNSQIRNALGVPVLPSGFAGTLRRITEALKTRRHLVLLPNLQSGATYEFEARSYDLENRPTPLGSGRFLTRLARDLRPLNIEAFDVQTIPTGAAIRWFTNRASDTQYSIELDGSVVTSGTADSDGTQAHIVLIEEGLEAGTEYTFTVSSTLVEETTLSDAEKTATRTGTFRTRRQILPLRFLGPPFRVVGSETAIIITALSRISSLTIDYGAVDSESTTISYSDSISSTEDLNRQTLTLTSLEPQTVYRYRLTAVSDGDTITSDPRGNRRWSRDLKFTTSAEGDTLPPEITQGPQVLARDKVAIFRWATDVGTSGTVFFGTLGENGTLGTADEFERIDFAPNGRPRFGQKHVVTITGLERNTTYGYRLESTAANGKTVTFDPNVTTSAKVARIQQPPGGSGSFVTSNDADTQFPVILSGPTISAKTHDTAVIEWTTDEPADSEIQFGTASLDDEETSGDNEASHKLTLSNLSAGTTYNYIVGSTDATGNGATESTQGDILGQRVRILVTDSNHKAGYHTRTWDGRDDSGRMVGSGLYLYRLKAGDFTQVRKMTLLK